MTFSDSFAFAFAFSLGRAFGLTFSAFIFASLVLFLRFNSPRPQRWQKLHLSALAHPSGLSFLYIQAQGLQLSGCDAEPLGEKAHRPSADGPGEKI